MRNRSRAGVTLIEMLIAVTLVSLLSVGMLFAIRTGINALERTNAQLLGNRRVLGAQRAIDQQIAGLMPVSCDGPARPGAPLQNATLFFHGQPRAMRFVSSYSLEEASRGYPRLLEYGVLQSPEGGLRLIVNEIPYTGAEALRPICGAPAAQSVQPRLRSFVLADRLARCDFRYQQPGQSAWQSVHTGRQPPSAIRIDMTPLEPGGARLQMATLTVPVRVTRIPSLEYKDLEDEEPQ